MDTTLTPTETSRPQGADGRPGHAALPNPPFATGVSTLEDGRTMGWAEYGDHDGDTVFWFPGTPGARCQVPSDLNAEASKRRLRIITVERPGTGDSTGHSYASIVEFVPDLETVAADLGIDRFAVVGLSGGGPYVLATAHELGDRVVCGTVLGGIGPTRGPDAVISHTMLLVPAAAALERIRVPLGRALGTVIRALGPFGDPFVDAFFWLEFGDRAPMTAKPDMKRQMVRDLVDAATRSGLRAPIEDLILFGRHWGFEIGDIRVPITFWGGTNDIIVPYFHAERQSKRVPGASLRTVHHGGHFAGYTDVGAVLDGIREQWPVVRSARPPRTRATKSAPRTGRATRPA